jgi:hypothetical protein
MKSMAIGIFLAVFASAVFAQDDAAAARAAAGCGPAQVQFDVKTDKTQHPSPQPESGKALVYVFEVQLRDRDINYLGLSVTTKIGLDGGWVGANHGESYFYFSVDAGDHRLCAIWQSSLERYSRNASAISLTAEAGKVYYFRTIVDQRKEQHQPVVKLEPLDPAEGQILVAASAFSTSHPKK